MAPAGVTPASSSTIELGIFEYVVNWVTDDGVSGLCVNQELMNQFRSTDSQPGTAVLIQVTVPEMLVVE